MSLGTASRLAFLGAGLWALGLLAWGLVGGSPPGRAPVQARTPAPDFTLPSFEGEPVTLSDLWGRVVVLNFWASWCPPCRQEMPAFQRVWDAYRDKGVLFLGINIQDDEAEARAFLREFGITYPNLLDPPGRVATLYGAVGIPSTFVIAQDGTLRRHRVGALKEKALIGMIEEAMRGG